MTKAKAKARVKAKAKVKTRTGKTEKATTTNNGLIRAIRTTDGVMGRNRPTISQISITRASGVCVIGAVTHYPVVLFSHIAVG